MSDRRQSAATAAVGYGLVGAGGAIRGGAIDDAHEAVHAEKRMFPASRAILEVHRAKHPAAGKIVRRFARGSTLATIGAPAAAVGTVGLLRRRKKGLVSKADTATKKRNLLSEGVGGTAGAWKAKGESVRSGAPMHVRATAVTLGTAGGVGGALLAHHGLNLAGKLVKVGSKTRAGVTAAAAVPGALSTMPASNLIARRRGYKVTATGTEKVTKAQTTYKRNDYLGRHVTGPQQRVRVVAAGAAPGPLVGPIAAAHQAARYAPPGQHRRAAARQVAGGPIAGGVAGLYAGKKVGQLADRSAGVDSVLRRGLGHVERAKARLPEKVRPFVPLKTAEHMTPKKAGAVAGFLVGHAIVGAAGGQLATSRNLAAERKFNAHHPVSKSAFSEGYAQQKAKQALRKSQPRVIHATIAPPSHRSGTGSHRYGKAFDDIACGKSSNRAFMDHEGTVAGKNFNVVNCPKCLKVLGIAKALDNPGMTDKQKGQLIRRKKLSAGLNVIGAGAGLGALAMIGAKHPAGIERRTKLLAGAAGVGGFNALNSASISHREAKAEKATIVSKHDFGLTHARQGAHTLCGKHVKDVGHTTVDAAKVECNRCRGVMKRALGPHAIWADGYGAISKSALVGGGYAPANKLSRKKLAAAPGAQKSMAGNDMGGYNRLYPTSGLDKLATVQSSRVKNLSFASSTSPELRRRIEDIHGSRPLRYRVTVHSHAPAELGMPHHAIAAAFNTPKGATRHVIVPEHNAGNASDSQLSRIWHHEVTHTQRKTSGLQLPGARFSPNTMQRGKINLSRASWGEEARADHVSAKTGKLMTGYESGPSKDYHKARRKLDPAWRRPQLHDRLDGALANAKMGGFRHSKLPASLAAAAHLSRHRGPYALGAAAVAGGTAVHHQVSKVSSQPPLKTTMNDKEAHSLVHGKTGYGLTGPLPHSLDRKNRMDAYQARYIASGGKKSQRWQRIANAGNNLATAGVAGATAAGVALIGTKSKGAKKLVAPLHRLKHFEGLNSEKVKKHAEYAGVAAATAGGMGQLVTQGAKKRRSKYTSAPGGVAASNYRRMQAYTPGG